MAVRILKRCFSINLLGNLRFRSRKMRRFLLPTHFPLYYHPPVLIVYIFFMCVCIIYVYSFMYIYIFLKIQEGSVSDGFNGQDSHFRSRFNHEKPKKDVQFW